MAPCYLVLAKEKQSSVEYFPFLLYFQSHYQRIKVLHLNFEEKLTLLFELNLLDGTSRDYIKNLILKSNPVTSITDKSTPISNYMISNLPPPFWMRGRV